jgi:hypothetical protein
MRNWMNAWYRELMLVGMLVEIALIFYLCLKAR